MKEITIRLKLDGLNIEIGPGKCQPITNWKLCEAIFYTKFHYPCDICIDYDYRLGSDISNIEIENDTNLLIKIPVWEHDHYFDTIDEFISVIERATLDVHYLFDKEDIDDGSDLFIPSSNVEIVGYRDEIPFGVLLK